MPHRSRFIALGLTLVLALPASATERSRSARASFQRDQPCPATGGTHGACKGYVVDHVQPLCAGGADAPSNMQRQSVADGKAKDRTERRQCRRH
jgi:hypothetical protein